MQPLIFLRYFFKQSVGTYSFLWLMRNSQQADGNYTATYLEQKKITVLIYYNGIICK